MKKEKIKKIKRFASMIGVFMTLLTFILALPVSAKYGESGGASSITIPAVISDVDAGLQLPQSILQVYCLNFTIHGYYETDTERVSEIGELDLLDDGYLFCHFRAYEGNARLRIYLGLDAGDWIEYDKIEQRWFYNGIRLSEGTTFGLSFLDGLIVNCRPFLLYRMTGIDYFFYDFALEEYNETIGKVEIDAYNEGAQFGYSEGYDVGYYDGTAQTVAEMQAEFKLMIVNLIRGLNDEPLLESTDNIDQLYPNSLSYYLQEYENAIHRKGFNSGAHEQALLDKLYVVNSLLEATMERPQLNDVTEMNRAGYTDTLQEYLLQCREAYKQIGQTEVMSSSFLLRQTINEIFQAPVKLINGALDFELFGINFASFVKALLTLSVVATIMYFVIKMLW